MDKELSTLNLIDLISERHKELRNKVQKSWKENNEEELSNTETYILSLIEKNNITMSEIARVIGISRQGVHKCVRNLENKGYVKLDYMINNQKEKSVVLTEKGKGCYNIINNIKSQIEDEIKNNIGEESLEKLRKILCEKFLNEEK